MTQAESKTLHFTNKTRDFKTPTSSFPTPFQKPPNCKSNERWVKFVNEAHTKVYLEIVLVTLIKLIIVEAWQFKCIRKLDVYIQRTVTCIQFFFFGFFYPRWKLSTSKAQTAKNGLARVKNSKAKREEKGWASCATTCGLWLSFSHGRLNVLRHFQQQEHGALTKKKGWGCLNHHTLPFGLDPPLTGIAIRAFEDFTA